MHVDSHIKQTPLRRTGETAMASPKGKVFRVNAKRIVRQKKVLKKRLQAILALLTKRSTYMTAIFIVAFAYTIHYFLNVRPYELPGLHKPIEGGECCACFASVASALRLRIRPPTSMTGHCLD